MLTHFTDEEVDQERVNFSHGCMDTVVVIKIVYKYFIYPPSRYRVRLYFLTLFEVKDGHVTSGWNFLKSLCNSPYSLLPLAVIIKTYTKLKQRFPTNMDWYIWHKWEINFMHLFDRSGVFTVQHLGSSARITVLAHAFHLSDRGSQDWMGE